MLHALEKNALTLFMDSFALFLGAWVILSVFLGYTIGTNPFLVIFLSFAFVFVLGKARKNFTGREMKGNENNTIFFWTGLFLLALCSLVFFGMQQGFDLSADAAPTFASRLIYEKIPLTYRPFFELPFLYPPGLPSLISQLTWTTVSDHLLAWIFALVGMLLFLYYFLGWGAQHGLEKRALWLAGAFFLGARLPYLSLWRGEYPLLMGFGIGMAGLAWYVHSWKRASIFLGAAFALHPYAGITIGLGVLLQQWAGPMKTWEGWMRFLKMGLVAILLNGPLLLVQGGLLSQYSTRSAFAGASGLGLADISGMVSLVGLITVLFFIGGIFGVMLQQKKEGGKPLTSEKIFWAFTLIGFGGYGVASFFPSFVIGGKVLVLGTMGLALLAAQIWSSQIANEKNWKIVGVVILVASMGVLFSSNDIRHTIHGSKASLEEASVSPTLAQWIPAGSTVLFLSPGEGKMAQYSHTIPADAVTSHYFSSVLLNTIQHSEIDKIKESSRRSNEIRESQCVECVQEMDVDYVVVNTRVFPPIPFLEKIGKTGAFVVYAK